MRDGDKMSLSQTIIFGMIFPLMFCSIGSLFARKGYVYFKAKKDKKHKCLTQTEGKIVSVNAMRINRRCAYFYTYEYEVNYEIITIEINFGTTYPQFREGDQVKIWYEKIILSIAILMVIRKMVLQQLYHVLLGQCL